MSRFRRLNAGLCLPVLMLLERWAWNELLFWAGLPARPETMAPPVGEFLVWTALNYQLLFVWWPRLGRVWASKL